jgi:isopentenyl-diphosphate delta-isomerase
MSKDYVILVNKNNRKIGITEKMRAHQEGKLHRAFSIFIFNSRGEFLIQQRVKSKYHSGRLWSNTVCSHPRPNETYKQAVHRRLKEEMGFNCLVKKQFCFIYNTGFKNGLIENEYDCVFVGVFDGMPKPNRKEVMNCKWISRKAIQHDIKKHPNKYSVWFKKVLPRVKLP